MTKRRYHLIIAALLLAAATAVTAIRLGNPHDFTKEECLRCHVDPQNKYQVLRAPVTRLCKYCHKRLIMTSSHPVDVLPSGVSIPNDFPLRDGKITCATCHNIHLERRTLLGSRTYFLRRPTSDLKFFCISCHQEDPLNPGHLLVITAHAGNRYRVTNPGEPLDPMSMECIGCHDGTIAKRADFVIGSGVWKHTDDPHPIGVNYERARMRKGNLAPLSQVDRRIRLFSGRLGCGTCHDTYSRNSKKLVMDRSTRLCTNCHYDK